MRKEKNVGVYPFLPAGKFRAGVAVEFLASNHISIVQYQGPSIPVCHPVVVSILKSLPIVLSTL